MNSICLQGSKSASSSQSVCGSAELYFDIDLAVINRIKTSLEP